MRMGVMLLSLLLTASCGFAQVFNCLPEKVQRACFGIGKRGKIDPNSYVTVKIMKRDLDVAGETMKKLSNDAVHYHAVAFDSDGKVVGDFGWTGEGKPIKDVLLGSKGQVFSEPCYRFVLDYDQKAVAEAMVAFKDWTLAERQFRYNEAKSGYRALNNGVSDYHAPMMKGGREYFNCQFAMSRFWEELSKTATFVGSPILPWPGGNADIITVVKSIADAASGESGRGHVSASPDRAGQIQPMQAEVDSVQSLQSSPGYGNAATAYQIPSHDMAALASQTADLIGRVQAQRHACTSFEYVKDYTGADRQPYMKLYRCTECGQGTTVNTRSGETIEDVIASNRQRQDFADRSYGFAQSALQAMPAAMGTPGVAGRYGTVPGP